MVRRSCGPGRPYLRRSSLSVDCNRASGLHRSSAAPDAQVAHRMAPHAPMTEHQLNIAVLTSRAAGIELAAELQHLPELGSLTIVTTSLAPGRSLPRKLRTILRHQGVPGLWAALRNRVRRPSGANQKASLAARIAERCPSARHLHCHDLHAPASLARLRELAP